MENTEAFRPSISVFRSNNQQHPTISSSGNAKPKICDQVVENDKMEVVQAQANENDETDVEFQNIQVPVAENAQHVDENSKNMIAEEQESFISERVSPLDDKAKPTVEESLVDFKVPQGWLFSQSEKGVKMVKLNDDTGGAIINLTVDFEFNILLKVCNKLENEHQPLFANEVRGAEDLRKFIEKLETLHICLGIDEEEYQAICREYPKNYYHCWITNVMRSNNCSLLSHVKKCGNCIKQRYYIRQIVAKRLNRKIPAKLHSFNQLSKPELINKLKQSRNQASNLKGRLNRKEKKIQNIIKKNGSELNDETHACFLNILDKNVGKTTDSSDKDIDFPTMFLRAQLKMFKNDKKKTRRWHPLVINWCLFM